jgi:hypothetical protein
MEGVGAVQKNVRSVVAKEECWCFSLRTNALPVTAQGGLLLWNSARVVIAQEGRMFCSPQVKLVSSDLKIVKRKESSWDFNPYQ